MKTFKLLILLLVFSSVAAQNNPFHPRFMDDNYFTLSIAIDPIASYKEKGPNLVGEIEVISGWQYVKGSVQIFPKLEGGYIDIVGAMGINITTDIFNTFRYYGGVRCGVIYRENYGYPLFGIEGGIDRNFENWFIGIRGTGDYRSDFKYSGANPEIRYSGWVRLGIKF